MKVLPRKMPTLALLMILTACGGSIEPNPRLTKSDAKALVETGGARESVCADNGFTQDNICDSWCPDGDVEDCGLNDSCTDGESRPSADGCNTCECHDGQWACTERACAEPPDDTTPGEPTDPTDSEVLPLKIGECDTDTDPLQTHTAKISVDRLIVDIGYSGGCREHTVRACWNGSFLESNPVQTSIVLEHDANGDMCEAYLQGTLEIDLTPMRENYEMGYPGTDGIILLGVGDQSLSYEF